MKRTGYLAIDGKPVKQVNKRTAERMYNNKKTVFLLPCNVSMNSVWVQPFPITQAQNDDQSFMSVVNSYVYYNCIKELGRYPNYFIYI